MRRAGLDLEELSRTGAALDLPPKVSRVADNYNHLHEQPTLFYALVLCAGLLGAVDSVQIALSWSYVGLRVVHSMIQATKNVIMARFLAFALGSAALFLLFLRTLYLLV